MQSTKLVLLRTLRMRFKLCLVQGAENIVLEGVLHKMASNGSASADHKWYGSEAVIDQWLSHLVQ